MCWRHSSFFLPDQQRGAFAKEDGEAVVDGKGELIAGRIS
jgi:hypothetical protein